MMGWKIIWKTDTKSGKIVLEVFEKDGIVRNCSMVIEEIKMPSGRTYTTFLSFDPQFLAELKDSLSKLRIGEK